MDGRWRYRTLLTIIAGLVLMIGLTTIITLLPTSSQTTASSTFRELGDTKDGIFFLGHIYSIDIPNRTFQVFWIVGGCGSLRLVTAERYDSGSSQCGPPNVPMDVYYEGAKVYTYDLGYQPLDPLTNRTSIYTLARYSHRALPSPKDRVFDQAFWYPFDFYHASATIIALNADNNATLPISRFVFVNPVNNFAPISIETATQTMFNDVLVDSRTTRLELRRTVNAKLYTMILFVVNWLLTLMVAYITMRVQLGENISEGIVVLPLTIILTLPTIRNLFVENPPFGILLDSLGLVLQMIVVSLCSVIILLPSILGFRPVSTKED